jgi:regulator of sigma E protease
MSVLIFFLVLFVLILVHEWGHFIAAKKTGMRVDEFGIGFPPKLYGIKKGETEYTLNALPIGGFVRIYGENPDAIDEGDPDKARAFGSRPRLAQAIVLVAGVTMNVIFAWFLFFITFVAGVPTAIDEGEATQEAVLYVSGILPNSPLFEEVEPGSKILSIGSGETVLQNPTPTSFSEFIQNNSSDKVDIKFAKGGEESIVSVQPELGLIPDDRDRAAVGVSLALVETKSYSVGESLWSATEATYSGLINITVGLFTLLSQAITGTADFSQVAGPVGIVGMVGDAADFGLVALLTFTAMISLNLAVINMLPIPALDGGRLVFVIIESITRKTINPVWIGRTNLVGFILLMALMIAVTYNDILRLF